MCIRDSARAERRGHEPHGLCSHLPSRAAHSDLAGHRSPARERRPPGSPARAGKDGPRHGCVRLGGRGRA
eukprot:8117469-Alexandrium_andersonii.AAC.1